MQVVFIREIIRRCYVIIAVSSLTYTTGSLSNAILTVKGMVGVNELRPSVYALAVARLRPRRHSNYYTIVMRCVSVYDLLCL